MRAYWAYFQYVMRHKWHVFVGCLRLGVPLHQAIIHDWVKFLPIEWNAYVRQFYNPDGTKRGRGESSTAFHFAWLHHQRQPHHWQAWVSIGDGGKLTPLPMPQRFILEMVADWYGAGKAISGKNDIAGWYGKMREKILLDPATRVEVELIIERIKDAK